MKNYQFFENLSLPTLSNYCCDFFAPDEPGSRGFRQNYPHKVSYYFNSRGYRDFEWPTEISALTNAIWCVGDSATLGIGVPIKHTWPSVLNQRANSRCINISLRGASNQWICRQVCELLQSSIPTQIVIQWSFLHRREHSVDDAIDQLFLQFYSKIKDPTWPQIKHFKDFYTLPDTIQQEITSMHSCDVGSDSKKISLWNIIDSKKFTWLDETRSLHYAHTSTEDDIKLTLELIDLVESNKNNCRILHCFIPDFLDTPSIKQFEFCFYQRYKQPIIRAKQVDFARDGGHYDIITSMLYVDKILEKL